MPTQIQKIEAHASHLLDAFITLRERYALLDPMLFDPDVPRLMLDSQLTKSGEDFWRSTGV